MKRLVTTINRIAMDLKRFTGKILKKTRNIIFILLHIKNVIFLQKEKLFSFSSGKQILLSSSKNKRIEEPRPAQVQDGFTQVLT